MSEVVTADPWAEGSSPDGRVEVTVTLKSGKGYDDPWLVFRGSVDAVREELCRSFRYSEDPSCPSSLADLTLILAADWEVLRKATVSVGSGGLGGRVLNPQTNVPVDYGVRPDDKRTDEGAKAHGASSMTFDGVDVNVESALTDAAKRLLNDIRSAGSEQVLSGLWKQHGTLIHNHATSLEVAWKHRRDVLREQAKKSA